MDNERYKMLIEILQKKMVPNQKMQKNIKVKNK